MANLDTMFFLLRDGRVDFGQFVAATRREYRAMAGYLLSRWPTTGSFTVEDLEQELYLSTWQMVWGYAGRDGRHIDYDPTRGVSLARWIVFGAMSGAKRELHRARGVSLSGSPDRKPSRAAVPVSALAREAEDADAVFDRVLFTQPEAEERIASVQETRLAATCALAACETTDERYAVLAIREAGSLDGAAGVLYDDAEHRADLGLECEKAAQRYVTRHAGRVARRIDKARVNSS